MQLNYVDMDSEVKPNLCQFFQEYALTNGKYNNAALICIWTIIFMLFGPVYAILYSFPISLMFGMIASFECFCCVTDLEGTVGLLLLPLRLAQALVVMGLMVVFNVVFWAIMLVPAYVLVFSWGFRMLYYWTCGRSLNHRPKVV